MSSTAVGQTSAITGDIYLTANSLAPAQPSRLRVDLRTLRSDESRPDSWLQRNTLRTAEFPFAEFVAESISGYPAGSVEGTEFTVMVSGQMTIRDVTLPLTWEVKARRAGDALTAIADTDFRMTDFGITPPDVGFAKSEDGVHLQVVLVAKLRAG